MLSLPTALSSPPWAVPAASAARAVANAYAHAHAHVSIIRAALCSTRYTSTTSARLAIEILYACPFQARHAMPLHPERKTVVGV